ncbi:hypothetical protein [Amycolatopsis jejuensis]|uniref:hypothetical protein n=1 Tax=Amycolatopsis jejuensis TaxID=330084 RepID=UPI000B1FE939|nr:hypothetical protein [Amycolatopsis jejuensis]
MKSGKLCCLVAVLVSVSVPAPAAAAERSWRLDLSVVDGDDFGVRATGTLQPTEDRPGIFISAEHHLSLAVDRVSARVKADRPPGVEAGSPHGVAVDPPSSLGAGQPPGVNADRPPGVETDPPHGAKAHQPPGIQANPPHGVPANPPHDVTMAPPHGVPVDPPHSIEAAPRPSIKADRPPNIGVNRPRDAKADRQPGVEADKPTSVKADRPHGVQVDPPSTLGADRPSGVKADRPPGIQVDVRGRTGDDWTEWVPAGAALPRAVTVVQARLTLSGPVAVRAVTLSADRVRRADPPPPQEPLTYRIYATREGLVGGTTSNGHKITERDHFVAFPSTKSVSPKGTGSYTARVCRTDGSRCEYAPVWEVGPWNEHDDFWNPADERATFASLPQGMPEAQAAYQNGFNDGKDARGRTVRNPAGVDLADGTFWDGLGLTGSSYIDITFLWTGSAPASGVVTTAGAPLNLRTAATTTAPVAGLAANYAKVPIECYVQGESVDGALGTTTIWHRIGPRHYVSEAYLRTGDAPVPPC